MSRHGADPGALLQAGIAHQRAGRLGDAARLYEQVLASAPNDANALNLLGLIHHAKGDTEAALPLLERAVSLRPDSPLFLGNLGAVLAAAGRLEAALARLLAALARRPGDPTINRNLGSVFYQRGDPATAARHYEQTLVAAPGDPDAHLGLAHAYKALGRLDAAAQSCRAALERRPDHAEARYLLAALEQRDVPDRPPASYVRAVFDAYAGRFERDLVETLGYHIPEAIAALVAEQIAAPTVAALDLGCGTGLCGAALKGRARRLVGIDLSARMIAKAQDRRIYDELHHGDILEYLPRLAPASFDLAIAADVFNYLGELGPVFEAIARLLQPGGHLVFTTEAAARPDNDPDNDGAKCDGFRLATTLRYVHAAEYVRRTAAGAGLCECAWRPVTIRRERNAPVAGDLFLYRR
ncbi:MAG: tetratricopeptide repeat protein [Alphaproteobacteria bacterium]